MLSSVCATADQYSITADATSEILELLHLGQYVPGALPLYSCLTYAVASPQWWWYLPPTGWFHTTSLCTVRGCSLSIWSAPSAWMSLWSWRKVDTAHFLLKRTDPQQPDHSEATAVLFLHRLLGAVELLQPVPAGASMWSGFHNSPQSTKILEAGGFEYKLGMFQPKATQADPVTVITKTESSHRLSASSDVTKHSQSSNTWDSSLLYSKRPSDKYFYSDNNILSILI